MAHAENTANWLNLRGEPVEIVPIMIVENPTVAAVEVVRCKDRKHWDKDFLWCDRKWGRTADDYFCSYGERRSDG